MEEFIDFRDRRIAVTGGAGFIGSHIVERLLDLGAEVTVIDNFLNGNKIKHLQGHKNLMVCNGDVRDPDAISRALKDRDICFHLAAVVGVEETQLSPLDVLDVEIIGTLNVLNFSCNNGVKRIVFASSSEVYGDSMKPMKEEGPYSPKSVYATTKLVGESYCQAFYHKYGLEYTCLRYFNVYGPRQDERFVIPRWVKCALTKEPIIIYGSGEQTRDFTYIDDAVDISLLAATRPETICQTINIGTGIMVEVNKIPHLIEKALDNSSIAGLTYVEYDAKRPRHIEIFYRIADISRIKSILNYEPETSLESGILKYINWCMNNNSS